MMREQIDYLERSIHEPRVLKVSKVKNIGNNAPMLVKQYFESTFGEVDEVLIVELPPKKGSVEKQYHASGFVVMRSVESAVAALAAGENHVVVAGNVLRVRPFDVNNRRLNQETTCAEVQKAVEAPLMLPGTAWCRSALVEDDRETSCGSPCSPCTVASWSSCTSTLGHLTPQQFDAVQEISPAHLMHVAMCQVYED